MHPKRLYLMLAAVDSPLVVTDSCINIVVSDRGIYIGRGTRSLKTACCI